MISGEFLVISCTALEESASHPLSMCKMECPTLFLAALRVPLAVTWLTVYRQLQMVRSILLQRQVSFVEAYARPLGNQVLFCQIVSKRRILDSNHHDFQRRFQLCSLQVLNPTTDVELGQHF